MSFTQGDHFQHLWTYAVGESEEKIPSNRCPCAGPDPNDLQYAPSCVGEHFYCESGFKTDFDYRIAWEDPLWDGHGCVNPDNQCCQRYGWFHRWMPLSSGAITVRWCSNDMYSDENILTDQLEIWVM